MRRLFAADWVRFGRRRDLWALLILVPIAMALMYLNEFNGTVDRVELDVFFDPEAAPDAQAQAEFEAQIELMRQQELPPFAFPASLLKLVGGPAAVILFGIYSAIALVAGEFEWGTIRSVHLTASRAAVLAARVAVILGLVAFTLVAALVLGAVLPFLLAVDGRPLQEFAGPVRDLWPRIGLGFLTVLPFIALPVLVSVITRSTSLAFLFTLLALVVDLMITGIPLWRDSALTWVPTITITGSIARLLSGENGAFASVPGVVPLIALAFWSVVPGFAAVWLIRRLDLE